MIFILCSYAAEEIEAECPLSKRLKARVLGIELLLISPDSDQLATIPIGTDRNNVEWLSVLT